MQSLNPLDTDPRVIPVSTYDTTFTVAVDTALRLRFGTPSPTSPVAQLIVHDGTKRQITLPSPCTVNGSKIEQEIDGTQLTAGWTYLLIVQFDDGDENIQAGFAELDCLI